LIHDFLKNEKHIKIHFLIFFMEERRAFFSPSRGACQNPHGLLSGVYCPSAQPEAFCIVDAAKEGHDWKAEGTDDLLVRPLPSSMGALVSRA